MKIRTTGRMRSSCGFCQRLLHLVRARDVERCNPATVGQLGIGSVANEKPDDLDLPAVDGPGQRCVIPGIAGVNCCAMIE
jgi:hypothetical protein